MSETPSPHQSEQPMRRAADQLHLDGLGDPATAAQRLLGNLTHREAEIKYDTDEAYQATVRDAARMENNFRDSEQMRNHDQMTGVLNRVGEQAALIGRDERIAALPEAKKPKATMLFFIDGNKFGLVNKMYGNDAGDEVIKAMSDSISQALAGALDDALRQNDIICRLGGDEFRVTVDLYADDIENAKKTVESRLREALQKITVFHNGQELEISASVGKEELAGSATKDDIELASLKADELMQKEKLKGKQEAAYQARVEELRRVDWSSRT